MYGTFLGIPAGFIAALVLFRFGPDWFMSWQIAYALGVCAFMIIHHAAKGIDAVNHAKLDNPKPWDCPESLPMAMGKVNECLREAHYGPHFWEIKTLDTDETRIFASLRFKEEAGTPMNPMQLDRMMLLDVYFEATEVPDPAAKPEEAKKVPGTKVLLRWFVESSWSRNTCNEIIAKTTNTLQTLLGAKAPEPVKPRSPYAPPQWLAATTGTLLVFGAWHAMDARDEIQRRAQAMKEQREAQVAAEEQRRQQIQQLYNQNRQKGYGVSPVNPFAPSLEIPQNNTATTNNSTSGLIPNPYTDTTNPPTNSTNTTTSPPSWTSQGAINSLPSLNNGGGVYNLPLNQPQTQQPTDPWKTPYSDLQPKSGPFTSVPQNNSENNAAPDWRAHY